MSNIKSKIESLLFVSGEEISLKAIKKALGEAGDDEIWEAVNALAEDYKDRGVRVIQKDDKMQMVSAPENAPVIETLVKSHLAGELSQVSLEALACVAYHEPISKIEIDELRGVNSVFSLRSLSMRGLIEESASSENSDSKTKYYKTTLDFLKKLGIEKVSDLPRYDEFSRIPQK